MNTEIINTEIINFITKTNDIKGVSFASIKGYESSTNGEIANHKINLGASFWNAKAKDFKEFAQLNIADYFKNLTENQLQRFAKVPTLELFTKAYINVYNSLVNVGDKLYNGEIKKQSNRSKGHNDAYTIINNSVKFHNQKEQLYLYGLTVSKEVIKKGEPNTTKSRDLTIAQNLLKKGMKHRNFRYYIVNQADIMNMAKTTFNGENLSIDL